MVFRSGIEGVQITGLWVPAEVHNGTDHAILDCEYSLRPEELLPASGLVVKWFYNNSPAPVYQWIVGNKPQVIRPPPHIRYYIRDLSSYHSGNTT